MSELRRTVQSITDIESALDDLLKEAYNIPDEAAMLRPEDMQLLRRYADISTENTYCAIRWAFLLGFVKGTKRAA